jgi:hypothetical protein
VFNLVFALNRDDILLKWAKLEDPREQDQPE